MKRTRREVLSSGLMGMAAGLTSGLTRAGQSSRPNILWLVSEDNNPLLGAYGDHLAHTPVIDALARRGILYRRAYANAPVCALSRFGILTGVYPESCAPAHQMRARAEVARSLKGYPEYLREVGYYCCNNAKTDYNCDIDPQRIWNDSSTKAHWRNRPAGMPFMAVFNYETTHEATIIRLTNGAVNPDEVRVPAYLPDTPDIRRGMANYYDKIAMMDGQLGARLKELEADGLTDETIIFYYSDHGGVAPRSKMFCYDEGLRACLIVAFPPKYAHLAPQPLGSVIEAPVSFIDLAPTVLSLAGVPKPSPMVGDALLGRKAGIPKPYVFGARNRMDERYDMTRTVTDGRYRYLRNYMPHRPWGQHYSYPWQIKGYEDWERQYLAGKLNAVQSRFFGPKPYEEFYDLQVDPDQVSNLIDRPDQQARVTTLRSVLDAHLLSINDNGFIPEGSPLEGYLNSRVPAAYPLTRIMAIAASAASGDVSQLSTFEAGLSDANEVVRYWSAQGLLILGQKAARARTALEKMMHQDASPQVRVVAAEACVNLGGIEAGMRVLANLMEHPSYPVRLQALNALTFAGDLARAVLPEIERAWTQVDLEAWPDAWTIMAAARYLSAWLRKEYDPSDLIYDMQWMQTQSMKRAAAGS